MHGNVLELCVDKWMTSEFDGSDKVDPVRGNSTPGSIVARGGSWLNKAQDCRAAARAQVVTPQQGSMAYGVLLALVPERPAGE